MFISRFQLLYSKAPCDKGGIRNKRVAASLRHHGGSFLIGQDDVLDGVWSVLEVSRVEVGGVGRQEELCDRSVCRAVVRNGRPIALTLVPVKALGRFHASDLHCDDV